MKLKLKLPCVVCGTLVLLMNVVGSDLEIWEYGGVDKCLLPPSHESGFKGESQGQGVILFF